VNLSKAQRYKAIADKAEAGRRKGETDQRAFTRYILEDETG
jgi:hypothetical protein